MTGEGGGRIYKVVRRVRESETVVSLHLAPADGGALAPFEPGQFLTFRLEGPDGRPVARNYSISSDPGDLSHYRISVKQEPGGLGSGHMHGRMAPGETIQAMGPKGRFTLDRASRRAVILLAGGIGVTPLTAMAHALAAEGTRPTWLLHACRTQALTPFADELDGLAARAPNFTRMLALDDGQAGPITRETLRSWLPLDDYEAYLCGPKPFMQAMFDALLSLGLAEDRIAYEFFGPAEKLGRAVALPPARASLDAAAPSVGAPMSAASAMAAAPSDATPIVVFAASGVSAPWDASQRTLLDFAEAQGLSPAFSCRNGICNTCLCEVEGRVRYVEEPLEEPPAGQALLCCSVPDGPVTVRI
jgi:ferredoxin-NADP reductase/ferredoxin